MSFVSNDSQQISLNDSTFNLTEREKRVLEKSWAKVFADKVFPAIDEKIFSVLYSEKASRPNTPVNVIIGAELESEIPVCKINFRFSISLARLNSGKLKLLYFSGS